MNSDLGREELKGRQVLVAEDNKVNLRLLRNLLERLGCKVTLAADGQEAWELYVQGPQNYDFIISDIQMPRMDGLVLGESIRRKEKKDGLRPLPLVAYTASTSRLDIEKIQKAGMNAWLAKPATGNKLAQILSSLLACSPLEEACWLGSAGLSLQENTTPAMEGRKAEGVPEDGPDLQQILALDKETARNILTYYLEDFPAYAEKLPALIREENAAGLCFTAHKLKGGLMILGADRAQKLAEILECQGRDANLQGAEAIALELQGLLEEILLAIEELLKTL